MKKYVLFFLSLIALLLVLTLVPDPFINGRSSAGPGGIGTHSKAKCSSFCLKNNGYAVFGTNLDHNLVYEGMLYVNKRGVSKQVRFDWPAKWVSKYASITFNLAGYEFAWSGMNEKGLMVSTMALDESLGPEPDARPGLNGAVWLQYVLDMCEDIDDVIAIDSEVRILGPEADHFLISDRYGNCGVVEFLDGQMVVDRGEGLPVAALTNSLYTESVRQWQFKNQGSQWERFDASYARFVKAADRVTAFSSRDFDAAVNYAFDTLYSVRFEQYMEGAASHWSIVYDARNMRIYFRTFYHPEIRYLDFWKMDMSCDTPVKMLDIQEALTGDVADDFIDYSHEASYDFFLNFANKWGLDFSPSYIDQWLRSCEAFPCTEAKPADEVLVSKDVLKRNATPRVAISTTTGDALVVWQQRDPDDESYSRIYSAMLKRSLSGRYQLSDSGLLSEKAGFDKRPFPVYLESQDRFLVVWDQADPEQSSDRSDIVGRVVSACGLPEGAAFKVLANGDRNECPQLYAKPLGVSGPATKNQERISLVFSAVGTSGKLAGVAQLKIAVLNGKYHARKAKLLMQGDVEDGSADFVPVRILPVGRGGSFAGDSIVLPVLVEEVGKNGAVRSQPEVVVIDSANCLADIEEIGKPGATRPSVAVFTDGENDATVICSSILHKQVTDKVMSIPVDGRPPLLTQVSEKTVYKKALDSLVLPFNPADQDQQAASDASAAKTIGYQFFAAGNGVVYRRAISEQGKLIGPFKAVFSHSNALQWMCGSGITIGGGNDGNKASDPADIILIWQKKVSKSLQEIRAQVLTAKH